MWELNPLAKIILGGLVVLIIISTTHILDLLEVFFTIVLIPVLFLVGIEMIGMGTYEAIREGFSRKVIKNLQDKINAYREEFRAA